MNKDRYNAEGYADPTAYKGMQKVIRAERETDRRASELVKVLKFIIRDKKTGRRYL